MIRKAVSLKLKDLAKLIPPIPEKIMLSIFDSLLKDENDFVRIPLLEALIILK